MATSITIPKLIQFFKTPDITLTNIIDVVSIIHTQFSDAEAQDLELLEKLILDLEDMKRANKSVYPIKWPVRDFLLTFMRKNM
jgi:hypothetical protein